MKLPGLRTSIVECADCFVIGFILCEEFVNGLLQVAFLGQPMHRCAVLGEVEGQTRANE